MLGLNPNIGKLTVEEILMKFNFDNYLRVIEGIEPADNYENISEKMENGYDTYDIANWIGDYFNYLLKSK
jgi:hypothetical protein